jgi:hypothetical protein
MYSKFGTKLNAKMVFFLEFLVTFLQTIERQYHHVFHKLEKKTRGYNHDIE